MELSPARSDRTELTLGLADLDAVTRTAMLRLDAPGDEAARSAYVGTVMQAALDLSSSLRSYAHCGLVNGRGSHGAGDLGRETARVVTAFERFAGLVRTPGIGGRAVRDAAGDRARRRAL